MASSQIDDDPLLVEFAQHLVHDLSVGLISEGVPVLGLVAELRPEAHVRSIFTKLDLAPDEDDHRRVLAVLSFLRS